MTTVVVVAGGPVPEESIVELLPPIDAVVAADSGVDHARTLGLVPTVVVGDLDSVTADGLEWARSQGAEVVEHPVDKDATDLDLAITMAARIADQVVVVDSGGGRLDHALANLMLLGSSRFAGVGLRGFIAGGMVTVVRERVRLGARPGDLLSLLALGGAAHGVSTTGLRWELDAATLEPGSTWGVSNEFTAETAGVSLSSGTLLAVQPTPRPLLG